MTTMHTTLRSHIVLSLGAAAGAVALASLMSTATAPAARADDFTDVITAVEGDFTAGQDAFTVADGDFADSNLIGGLSALFIGVNDDLLSAPNDLIGGVIGLANNGPIDGPDPWTDPVAPTSFSDGLSEAGTYFNYGLDELQAAGTYLSDGNFDGAAIEGLFGSDWISALAPEELLLASLTSF
jgi:hypothetical protein